MFESEEREWPDLVLPKKQDDAPLVLNRDATRRLAGQAQELLGEAGLLPVQTSYSDEVLEQVAQLRLTTFWSGAVATATPSDPSL
jgi:hypothetical protein